jgi:hypothetical protein
MFVELCPTDVVQEHKDELTSVVVGTWRDANINEPEENEPQIIEGEFQEK